MIECLAHTEFLALLEGRQCSRRREAEDAVGAALHLDAGVDEGLLHCPYGISPVTDLRERRRVEAHGADEAEEAGGARVDLAGRTQADGSLHEAKGVGGAVAEDAVDSATQREAAGNDGLLETDDRIALVANEGEGFDRADDAARIAGAGGVRGRGQCLTTHDGQGDRCSDRGENHVRTPW